MYSLLLYIHRERDYVEPQYCLFSAFHLFYYSTLQKNKSQEITIFKSKSFKL